MLVVEASFEAGALFILGALLVSTLSERSRLGLICAPSLVRAFPAILSLSVVTTRSRQSSVCPSRRSSIHPSPRKTPTADPSPIGEKTTRRMGILISKVDAVLGKYK
jgi:hypothetical protein